MKKIRVREKQQHKTNSEQQSEKVVARFIPDAKAKEAMSCVNLGKITVPRGQCKRMLCTNAKKGSAASNAVANYDCMRKMLKQEDKDIERAVRNLDKYLVNSK